MWLDQNELVFLELQSRGLQFNPRLKKKFKKLYFDFFEKFMYAYLKLKRQWTVIAICEVNIKRDFNSRGLILVGTKFYK